MCRFNLNTLSRRVRWACTNSSSVPLSIQGLCLGECEKRRRSGKLPDRGSFCDFMDNSLCTTAEWAHKGQQCQANKRQEPHQSLMQASVYPCLSVGGWELSTREKEEQTKEVEKGGTMASDNRLQEQELYS